MKIWLLQANEPMPIVHPGQRLFRMGMLASKLVKAGHDVTWFATTFDHFKKEQLYDKDTEIKVEKNYILKLIWAPKYKKNISVARIINHKYMAWRLRRMIKNMPKPDVIYVSFPTIDFAEEAVKYGKLNNIPVIVDIRDLWPDIFNHNLNRIKRIIAFPYIQLMQLKTKRIMKEAYAINAVSQSVLQWGLEKGKRTQKKFDRYFYLGYDNTPILDKSHTVSLEENKFSICFFGTLNKQFKFEYIKKIGEALPNVNIYVCGLGEEYEKIESENKNFSNVKMLGWLNKQDLQYVLNNCKIGLALYKPSFDFRMGVSNKFAEYLSYGLPIILTSGGYMGELIDENNCGLNSADIDKIVAYISLLCSNQKTYEEISNNAKMLYTNQFVADKIYDNVAKYIEEIYEEVKK